ncbi:hypothetical protein BD779DRAFT_1628379 [Infundibulicybe gibba]|nr:hypothetical protein BD779DRAFT_1628379 [Infundibulicybe gibba]
MLNWWIFGILIVQCCEWDHSFRLRRSRHSFGSLDIYRLSFPNDEKHLKALVYTLLLLETVQTMFTTADAFHWFAFGFGDMDSLSQFFLSNFDSPILGSIIAFIVQLVFCGRIWALSQSKILSGAIALFSVAQIVGGVGLGVVNQTIGRIIDFQDRGLAYIVLWLGGSAIADTLIAVSLTSLLLKSKSKSKQANDIVLGVVRLTVETNALTGMRRYSNWIHLRTIPPSSYYGYRCPLHNGHSIYCPSKDHNIHVSMLCPWKAVSPTQGHVSLPV